MFFNLDIKPYTFIENHISFFENILAESKGYLPLYKIGNKYFIAPDRYFELYFSYNFDDGIIMVNDIRDTIKNGLSILKTESILKAYPILTKCERGLYYVINGREKLGPMYIITTKIKPLIWIARKYFDNIDKIYKEHVLKIKNK